MSNLTDMDFRLLRQAIDFAHRARAHGNHPFGALLADADGHVLLEAENTVLTGRDATGHAETNLIRLASARCTPETLARCTLYTSTEPCPMCAGAIYWAGVGRVVYALPGAGSEKLLLPCRDVFARGGHPVEVLGPAIEDEARQPHEGFWGQ
jgi:tRNA(Arg) A34 adenosine deaminase TadA